MPKIPESEYATIAQLYDAGDSQTAIGNRYGVSHAYIGQILKKIGHPTRVGSSREYREQVAKNHEYIISAHEEGFSYAQIAENLNITTATVIYVLQQAGIWQQRKLTTQQKAQRAVKIVAAYVLGISIPKIRRKFNCAEKSVYQALEQAKVPVKAVGEHTARRGKANAYQFNELYLLGFSCKEIGDELGFSSGNVNYLLRKYYPKSLRSPAETRKKQELREIKLVNDTLMESDQYSALVSNSAFRDEKKKVKNGQR